MRSKLSTLYLKHSIWIVIALGVLGIALQREYLLIDLIQFLLFVLFFIIGRSMMSDVVDNHKEIEAKFTKTEAKQSLYIDKIAHEIRTPVYNATLTLQLLNEKRIPVDEIEKRMLALQSSMRYLSHMIVLLETSRNIIDGELNLNPENVHLSSTVQDIIDLFEMPERITTFERNIDDQDFYIDKTKFQQIILNLFSNSIKYGEDYIAVICAIDINGALVIQIGNSTRWIPEDDDIPRLLEVYQRDAAHADIEGRGIGLPIVTEIVKAMGGTFEFVNLEFGIAVMCRIPPR